MVRGIPSPAPPAADLRPLAAIAPPDVGPVTAVPSQRDERASDEELVSRGTAGVDGLYRRHHPGVYRFCVALLRNPDDAADACHSAWLRVITVVSGGRNDVVSFRPWLFAIARNECLDRLRAATGDRTVDVSGLDLAGGACPHERHEQRADLRTLLDDLSALSERQRSAIVLRELAGLDSGELADALSTSPARALGLVADARRSLLERRSGRSLPCELARHELSRMRRRSGQLRAHIAGCPPCQDFDRRRRGRALSSLGVAPWLLLRHRDIGERLGLDGGQVKAMTAAALIAGVAGTTAALPDREPADPRPDSRRADVVVPAQHRPENAREQRAVQQPSPRAAAKGSATRTAVPTSDAPARKRERRAPAGVERPLPGPEPKASSRPGTAWHAPRRPGGPRPPAPPAPPAEAPAASPTTSAVVPAADRSLIEVKLEVGADLGVRGEVTIGGTSIPADVGRLLSPGRGGGPTG